MPKESLGDERRPNFGPPAQSPFTKCGAHPMLSLKFIRYPHINFHEGYDSVIMIMHAAGHWGMLYDSIFKRLHTGAKTLKYSPTE